MSCGFSVLLVSTRIAVTGHLTYLFLVWNLFLAVVPYLITEWLTANPSRIDNKWRFALSTLVWLLFIPNSFYIITDLVHLDRFTSAPQWFDLLLLFSFVWNGILLGILSIRRMELLIKLVSGSAVSLLVIFIVMWLNAFGIYLGRFLRFNSWDIVAQPFALFDAMFEIILHPIENKMEWGMITVYAFFMTMLYSTVRKMAEHLNYQR